MVSKLERKRSSSKKGQSAAGDHCHMDDSVLHVVEGPLSGYHKRMRLATSSMDETSNSEPSPSPTHSPQRPTEKPQQRQQSDESLLHFFRDGKSTPPSTQLYGSCFNSSDDLPSNQLHEDLTKPQLPGYKMLPYGDDDLDAFGDMHADLLPDSGSDCVAMESHGSSTEAEPTCVDDEPYIDVVSEDSAIQDEDISDDMQSHGGMSYGDSQERMSSPPHIISSHDDSAILKSEIFDLGSYEMDQMLSSTSNPYDHDFLDPVSDHTSDFLRPVSTSVFHSPSPAHTGTSCDEMSSPEKTSKPPTTATSKRKMASSGKHARASSSASRAPSVTSSLCSAVSSLAAAISVSNCSSAISANGAVGISAANWVKTNAGPAVANSSTVLTTPVFIAQGPAGQTSSIITTHMARLVPSPDGKGYILQLGLDPTQPNPLVAQATAMSTGLGTATTNLNLNTATAVASKLGTVSSQLAGFASHLPNAAALGANLHAASFTPASFNITITPAGTQVANLRTNFELGAPTHLSKASESSGWDISTPVPADVASLTSSPLGGSTLETDHDGNIVLKSNSCGNRKEIMSVSDPVGTRVDNAILTPSQSQHTITTGNLLKSSLSDAIHASATSTQAPLMTEAESKLLDCPGGNSDAQLLRLVTQARTATSATLAPPKVKSSKRRNSRELRELMELEKLSATSNAGDELDRFVICSDGPMNCALCGYNTLSYSSFKSHIICSHPCWRITKKLSRNRLLVEKSVKVGIPVANFSVPNPIPAVPIQQRVQTKKAKKEKVEKDRVGDNTGNSASASGHGVAVKESKENKHSRHRVRQSSASAKLTRASLSSDTHTPKEEKRSGRSRGGAASARQQKAAANAERRKTQGTAAVATLTNRQRHIMERNKRLFRCTRCGRLFVFEATATSHVSDHHGLKRANDHLEISNDHGKIFHPIVRCTEGNCSFTCSSQQELEKHKGEKHAVQKVYRCQICGYFADSPKAVKEHASKIHPKNNFEFDLND